jgi:predicted DNA-binding protein
MFAKSHDRVCLTPALPIRTLKGMEIHFTPDIEAKLHALATETGRTADEFVQDALAGYFEALAQVRGMLDSRYDDIKSGQVQPIDGEAFFESLRQREEALLKKHTPQ